MPTPSALLHTQNLNLKVAERQLLLALNWQVHAGECWCVIGRNGIGKSTLLRTLASLREDYAGEIFLEGKKLEDWPLNDLARLRSYLPQARHDAFAYRAIDTVLSARHPYQENRYWESSDDYQFAFAMMQKLDVAELAERDVRQLSGGERQRVAIAAMLVQDASLMLLDEPSSALDLAHQVSVMQILGQVRKEENKALILVSHDLNLSYQVASHALLMMEGGQVILGPKEVVMQTQNLSLCLGHPIAKIRHGEQVLFFPQQAHSLDSK